MSITNLPKLSTNDLRAFAVKHNGGANHEELFGTRVLDGVRNATHDLANYAWNMTAARACRERGAISQSQMYENICDHIYNGLPVWARW